METGKAKVVGLQASMTDDLAVAGSSLPSASNFEFTTDKLAPQGHGSPLALIENAGTVVPSTAASADAPTAFAVALANVSDGCAAHSGDHDRVSAIAASCESAWPKSWALVIRHGTLTEPQPLEGLGHD
jgi:hypothetical protein